MNLMQASNQWAIRPADQRFWTLQEMFEVCGGYRDSARQSSVLYRQLRCEDVADDLQLVGPGGAPAKLTHWAFGKLAMRASAPAEYLRRLPAAMAADCINYGLERLEPADRVASIMFHKNGSLVARCITSEKYSRIWNADIVERLLPLVESGWQVPPARPAMVDQPGVRKATKADVLAFSQRNNSLAVKIGDAIAPAGLYASDHDMFAFLVNESAIIDDGSNGGLARGFFVSNSEVGAGSLKITKFLYRAVCGNHIVWGAQDVSEISVRHVGGAEGRFESHLIAELKRYSDSSANEDEAKIKEARRFLIGNTVDEVIDTLFGNRKLGLSRKTLDAAWIAAEKESAETNAGDPRSAWGFAQGLTRLSQDREYAADRSTIDVAAGRVIEMAF